MDTSSPNTNPEPLNHPDPVRQEGKKKKRRWGIVIAALIVLIAVITLLGARGGGSSGDSPSSAGAKSGNGQPSWAIYLYLCGSSLESDCGCATYNLSELNPDEMPENLTFVIVSGGAKQWWNDMFSSDCLQYWTMTAAEGLVKQKDLDQGNMGEQETLRNFLQFCSDRYPADNTMLVIWDHGSGPVYGCCLDENYPDTRSLQTKDIGAALEATFGSDMENPPIDIVNFDCCLMGSIDMAQILQGKARYLIASEETMDGAGEDYAGFVSAIQENPGIDPLQFGITVINNFEKKYSPDGERTNQTLSMTDLAQIGNVTQKLDTFCGELISGIYANPGSFCDLALCANDSEYYGDHSRTSHQYQNLVDIADLARSVGDSVSGSLPLIEAIDQAVVARYNGYYHRNSGGLSMFYSYNGDRDDLNSYLERGVSTAVKSLNELHTEENLTGDQRSFVTGLGLDADAVPDIKTFDTNGYVDTSVKKNQNGQYYVDFGPDTGTAMTDAMERLYLIRDGDVCILGTDDEVEVDWNEGIIINGFSGNWLQVGNYLASSELTYDCGDYNIYAIPVMYPGEDTTYYLQMVFDFRAGQWYGLGAIYDGANPGECAQFQVDDGQELRLIQAFLEDDGDGSSYSSHYYEVGSVQYSDDLIRYEQLPDGNYALELVAEDVHKNQICSDFIYFTISNGEIYYYQ